MCCITHKRRWRLGRKIARKSKNGKKGITWHISQTHPLKYQNQLSTEMEKQRRQKKLRNTAVQSNLSPDSREDTGNHQAHFQYEVTEFVDSDNEDSFDAVRNLDEASEEQQMFTDESKEKEASHSHHLHGQYI